MDENDADEGSQHDQSHTCGLALQIMKFELSPEFWKMLVTKHVATKELRIGYACQYRSKPANIQTDMDIEREPKGKRCPSLLRGKNFSIIPVQFINKNSVNYQIRRQNRNRHEAFLNAARRLMP
ncbi:hypothetical protein ACTXT7_007319 [Hymenolepis weldensis]